MSTYTQTQAIGSMLDRSNISGPALVAGDPGWESARQAWNLAVDQHPAAVVFPENAADIAEAGGSQSEQPPSQTRKPKSHGATSQCSRPHTKGNQ